MIQDVVFVQKVIVLSAKRYSMTDDKTGRLVEGVTVWYVLADDLTSKVMDRDTVGFQPCKVSLPVDRWDCFRIAPGVYDCGFAMRPVSGGKVQMQPVDLEFVSDIYGVREDSKK